MPTKIGMGPAISLIDRTTVYNSELRKNVVNIADEVGIPYQYRKTSMGENDSGKIHTSGEGCPTTTISVPCRYIHSPNSIMSIDDYNNAFRLLKEILLSY
jgi:endoglucanase